jgi:ABC-2 type transport system permease protein
MLLAPCGIALFMWIVQHPEAAASLGLLGTKANLAGLEPTWPAFSVYLNLVVGGGGLAMLGFVLAYLFGREYADGTSRNLLALPVERWWFILGKLVVATVWWAGLVVSATVVGYLLGWALDLPGRTQQALSAAAGSAFLAAALALLVSPLVAWVTIATRSYLAAIGFAFATMLMGNFALHTGWAGWVPWSIVFAAAADQTSLTAGSLVILLLTFCIGTLGAAVQLRRQDNP